MNTQRRMTTRRPHRLALPTAVALLGVAAASVAITLRAADPPRGDVPRVDVPRVNVTVEVGGEVYAGSVPRKLDAATTRPATPAEVLPGGPVPLAVHLDAIDVLDPAALRDVRVTWDFGDPAAGPRNVLDGYNAGHAYDAPGPYTITRTVTGPDGTSTRRYQVTATADARTPVYVSDAGDDANDGRTPEAAVRSWGRAVALVPASGRVAVLFRRGDRFVVDRTMPLRGDDSRVGAWGDAAAPRPVLALGVARSDVSTFAASGARVAIEDVAFDSDVVGAGTDKSNTADAIHAAGRGLLVRRCEFRAVNNAINGNGNPAGVLFEGCAAPLETGVRGYFAWVQGTNWTILDNRAINSTREHIIRVGGGERVNITGNRFANLDRRDAGRGGDAGDFSKTTVNVQKGRVAWVAGNVLRDGPVSVGPLGGADGKRYLDDRFVGATFEDNRIVGNEAQVQHGATGITWRNNLIERDDQPAFAIFGFSAEFARGCDDVALIGNTATNAGTRGTFARVGPGSTRVRLVRNVYAAPALVAGAYESSPVVVGDAQMSAFTAVEGNRWPAPARLTGDAARRGPFVFAGAYAPASLWQSAGPSDRVLPIAAGTLQVDGAGVDASRLPTP